MAKRGRSEDPYPSSIEPLKKKHRAIEHQIKFVWFNTVPSSITIHSLQHHLWKQYGLNAQLKLKTSVDSASYFYIEIDEKGRTELMKHSPITIQGQVIALSDAYEPPLGTNKYPILVRKVPSQCKEIHLKQLFSQFDGMLSVHVDDNMLCQSARIYFDSAQSLVKVAKKLALYSLKFEQQTLEIVIDPNTIDTLYTTNQHDIICDLIKLNFIEPKQCQFYHDERNSTLISFNPKHPSASHVLQRHMHRRTHTRRPYVRRSQMKHVRRDASAIINKPSKSTAHVVSPNITTSNDKCNKKQNEVPQLSTFGFGHPQYKSNTLVPPLSRRNTPHSNHSCPSFHHALHGDTHPTPHTSHTVPQNINTSNEKRMTKETQPHSPAFGQHQPKPHMHEQPVTSASTAQKFNTYVEYSRQKLHAAEKRQRELESARNAKTKGVSIISPDKDGDKDAANANDNGSLDLGLMGYTTANTTNTSTPSKPNANAQLQKQQTEDPMRGYMYGGQPPQPSKPTPQQRYISAQKAKLKANIRQHALKYVKPPPDPTDETYPLWYQRLRKVENIIYAKHCLKYMNKQRKRMEAAAAANAEQKKETKQPPPYSPPPNAQQQQQCHSPLNTHYGTPHSPPFHQAPPPQAQHHHLHPHPQYGPPLHTHHSQQQRSQPPQQRHPAHPPHSDATHSMHPSAVSGSPQEHQQAPPHHQQQQQHLPQHRMAHLNTSPPPEQAHHHHPHPPHQYGPPPHTHHSPQQRSQPTQQRHPAHHPHSDATHSMHPSAVSGSPQEHQQAPPHHHQQQQHLSQHRMAHLNIPPPPQQQRPHSPTSMSPQNSTNYPQTQSPYNIQQHQSQQSNILRSIENTMVTPSYVIPPQIPSASNREMVMGFENKLLKCKLFGNPVNKKDVNKCLFTHRVDAPSSMFTKMSFGENKDLFFSPPIMEILI